MDLADWASNLVDERNREVCEEIEAVVIANRAEDMARFKDKTPDELAALDRCARCKGRYVRGDYVNGHGDRYCSRGCAQETPSSDHLFANAYHYGPATGRRWLGPL